MLFLPFGVFRIRKIIQLLQANLYFQLRYFLSLIFSVLLNRNRLWIRAFNKLRKRLALHSFYEGQFIRRLAAFELSNMFLVHFILSTLCLFINVEQKVPLHILFLSLVHLLLINLFLIINSLNHLLIYQLLDLVGFLAAAIGLIFGIRVDFALFLLSELWLDYSLLFTFDAHEIFALGLLAFVSKLRLKA